MMTNQNYYDILGVSNNASSIEIKIAYRTLAQSYHPDHHAENPLAELAAEKFMEIKEAYETLSDPGKRRIYDERLGTSSSDSAYSSASTGINEIYSLIDQRLFARAHDLVDNMIASNASDPSLHAIKGYIYVEQDNNYSAVGSFETAMRHGLQDPDSFFVYGTSLIGVKKYREAIDIIQKSIDIRGEVPNYLANIAIAYELDGQKERAKSTWNRLEQIDSSNPILQQRKQVWKVGAGYHGKQETAVKACWACYIIECFFDCC